MSESKVIAKIVVSLHEDGLIGIDIPEGTESISYEATEDILRRAHQRMLENRLIASAANALLRAQQPAEGEIVDAPNQV